MRSRRPVRGRKVAGVTLPAGTGSPPRWRSPQRPSPWSRPRRGGTSRGPGARHSRQRPFPGRGCGSASLINVNLEATDTGHVGSPSGDDPRSGRFRVLPRNEIATWGFTSPCAGSPGIGTGRNHQASPANDPAPLGGRGERGPDHGSLQGPVVAACGKRSSAFRR